MDAENFKQDKLTVNVLPNRRALGLYAAAMVAERLKALTESQDFVNVIFAAAPSQNEFLEALIADQTINWHNINAFHMDEYIGLPVDAPQSFGNFLRARLFEKVPFASVNYIDGNAIDSKAECKRYARLLMKNQPDVVCMGIGENTHIAFNDPPVADFNDKLLVKTVLLDAACRQQQVNDGCFEKITDVPVKAITLTVPALMQPEFIYCMVPGHTKQSAIKHTLTEPISSEFPSTILRTHDHAILFVDRDSYQPA